ncbi:MAG: ABC transporter ATP-binding protein [Burkholderiales bacterium]|jgi:iron complex transport system ATP-binding protein|nr:ABC transporter ATP-binding protein [Burkholderiales bacterium]
MTVLACTDVELRAGHRVLVRGLSFAVQPGERWAVLGPNGAGKSTLLAVLAGVRPPASGSVTLGARLLSDWPVQQLAEQRALVTDRWVDPFAASVLDTVLTARYRFDGRDAEGVTVGRESLALMDCAHLLDADVRWLSRGERQRVAVATALAQATPLVLLDEPIAHQDPRHQVLVLERLAQLDGRSLIASLHDLSAGARFATHALLLDGRGGWRAGPVAQTMTAENLTQLFDTPIAALPLAGRPHYVALPPPL